MQRPAPKTVRDVTYRIETAGRAISSSGIQSILVTNKREAIRIARRSLNGQGFGAATSVTMIERGYPPFAKKPKTTLIFQAHVAKKRSGKLYVKVDEL